MMLKTASLALCLLYFTTALPVPDLETLHTLEGMENADDMVSVGSYIRETRAAPPADDDGYFKSNQHEGNGEIGYSRKKAGGGKKGYQKFDSYHKKAGDNYEFEKQDSYGLEDEKQDGAYSHRHERRAERDDDRKRKQEPEEFDEPEDEVELHGSKKPKQPKERHYEELKEGAGDGNGGVEAYGHDPNDYILPERYIYGEEE